MISCRLHSKLLEEITNAEVPKTIQEALQVPGWKAAVYEEMRVLKKNETCDVVGLPRGKCHVDCKWIFTIKY